MNSQPTETFQRLRNKQYFSSVEEFHFASKSWGKKKSHLMKIFQGRFLQNKKKLLGDAEISTQK